jgi:hypothetical protein
MRPKLSPAFRSQTKIVKLNRFTMEEIDGILSSHQGLDAT